MRGWSVLVFLLGILAAPTTLALAAAPDDTVVVGTVVDDTVVDDTAVDDTAVPTTTPDTVAPTTTGPGLPPQDSGVVGANPNLDSGEIALIAVVGLLAVLAIAAWWMVRNDDEDGRPAPPIDDSSML